MPRSRVPDSLTVDMFGFDPVGHAYSVSADENRMLLGLGVLCLAVYHVIKRFALAEGRVPAASYYRLSQVLAHRPNGPGRPLPEPSRKQLRTALATLKAAGLLFVPNDLNEQRGVLQIWVVHGVGVTSRQSKRAGNRAGSKRPQTRAVA